MTASSKHRPINEELVALLEGYVEAAKCGNMTSGALVAVFDGLEPRQACGYASADNDRMALAGGLLRLANTLAGTVGDNKN